MLLKSSHRLFRLSTFCCRSITYQVGKSNRSYLNEVHEQSFLFSNFTRNYSVTNEEKAINQHWIGSKPGDGKIAGRAASDLQESYIMDVVTSNEELSDDDWNKLRQDVFKIELGSYNNINIDGKILDCCFINNNFSLAKNYLKYLRSTGKKYNSSVVCSFIKICYENRLFCTQEDLTKIDQFTRYLLARYKVFDHIVGECVIKGLCLGNNWQKSAQILEEMAEYVEPNSEIISAYVTCLIQNDKIENAYSEIIAASRRNISLTKDVYLHWIRKHELYPDKVEQLLKLFQINNIIPKKTICDHLVSVYSEFPPENRLVGTFVSINNKGKCPNCDEKLQRVCINDEEFNLLRDEFLNRVLIRGDIFKNTSPEELKKFFKVVERNAPFDIVIDGLNVMYMHGTMKSDMFYAKLLTDTVRHFVDRNQRVLVIGRRHMYNFTKQHLEYLKENSTLFSINDMSEDDPYMIYSTFYSGPESCFVTRDLMRSEKFKLSSEKLALLFKRWQQSHQIFIEHLNYNTGRLFLKNPITFEMAAQPSIYGWHVPYHLDSYSGSDDYGVHENWLCLKK